ncbi:MAG: cytochrome c biogenesis protein CcsA [Bacteroidaceae bacterium]|nr:cytochrome c biogenesis protein CcsA [Bacteroidaceae bacterium]
MGWNIFPVWAAVVMALATTGAVIAALGKNRNVWATALMLLAIIGMAGFIAMLWIVLERPPLRTMGETRLWYSFFLLVAGLFTYSRWKYRWIMLFSTILAGVFIIINIVKPEIHDQTLMPALQSVWFVPHVSVYMFSYSLLGCATLLSTVALVRRNNDMDMAIEKLLYAGLAFLSIGMLTGSLWAKEAWGAYWSWDAKESWAVATWGLYLIAIHLAPSVMNTSRRWMYHTTILLGFLALQMCWYGINYLPSAETSIHTYNQ